MDLIDIRRGVTFEQFGKCCLVGSGVFCDHNGARRDLRKLQGLGKSAPILGIDHFGPHQIYCMAKPGMGPVDKRILLGHRDDRRADILRGQGKQTMLHAVAGDHHNRGVGTKTPAQQSGRDGASPLQRFKIGQCSPPRAAAFGHKDPAGRCFGPLMEPVPGDTRRPRHLVSGSQNY